MRQILREVRHFQPDSPDFAFAIGQTSRNLNSDNEVVTLNVVGVDVPNVLIDSVATCKPDGLANLELVES